MPFPIEEKLVIAVASSALFDLSESDAIFRENGAEEYRRYQREHENDTLGPGVAFPFIRRLLRLNGYWPDRPPVEVILLSRNDPDTGLRVFNSIDHHGLGMSRAAFTRGRAPYRYLEAFNASLFLSANESDVREAVMKGYPAGRVLGTFSEDDAADDELRIAFDFDGVLADDEAEQVFQAQGLNGFMASEKEKASLAMHAGPLNKLLHEVARLQQEERDRAQSDPSYKPRIRTAIITSRNAPAHKRMVTTLREWGILVDETFFLGGMDKNRIISIFRPHLFFDDQLSHAGPAAGAAPSVHVPFGAVNQPPPETK